MTEEKFVPPQFVYLDDLIKNQIELNDAVANYRVQPGPKTRRALLSNVAAMYMKIRSKLHQDNDAARKKLHDNNDKGPYALAIAIMEDYLLNSHIPTAQKLIEVAWIFNEWIESTGATQIKLEKAALPYNEAVRGKFRK